MSYGLDRKLAAALFGDTTGFPLPPPEPKQPRSGEADASTPADLAAYHRRQRLHARDGDGRLARTAIGCALLLGLRAIPRLDGIVQHGVEFIVGGQLGDAFP